MSILILLVIFIVIIIVGVMLIDRFSSNKPGNWDDF